MTCGNNGEIKKDLKICLIQLDFLFQWLAAVENKPIEKDGAEMGSNFAKFKIYPEYSDFIDYACEAEIHFSGVSDGNYHSVGTDCRMSLEGFMTYLYENEKLHLNEEYYKHTVKDEKLWCESNRIKGSSRKLSGKLNWKETDPKGYELGSKIGTNGKPRKLFWLDAAITSKEFQDFFTKNNAWPNVTEKRLAAEFCHYKKDKTFYSGEKALSILSMIYNLYAHCVGKKYFAGTPRYDVSVLENVPKELITPQLSIEVSETVKGDTEPAYMDEKIPQNELLKAVLSKKITEDFLKQNRSLINKTDVLGNTPLSLAVYNDDLDTVKMLLENGADPNFYFKNFSEDFHKSVNDEISKDSAKYSCVWSDYIEAHRCIPLIVAIKKDNVDIVKLLLQYSARTWDSCIDDLYTLAKISPECSTVLACAYYYNAEECIRFLLNKNDIDINQKTITEITPLMLAVENGRNYNKLLKKGARIDSKDNYRNSIFLHAVQNMRHDYELLESLLDKAKDDLNTEEMKKLLNHAGLAGCPISYMNEKEAKLFLEYGADINAKNEMGVSCVVDVAHLNPELLPWFKENGAKLDFKALFYCSSYLEIKNHFRIREYKRSFFTEVLKVADKYNLITSSDLDFTVPIDNVPRISPLVDAMLFSKAKIIQINTEYEKEKQHSVDELSKTQKIKLFERNPFIKKLERCGIDYNIQEEVEAYYSNDKLILESTGSGNAWEMSPTEIMSAVNEIKTQIPYEDVKISPLDDALIAKNYEGAAIYLSKGIKVSELTKLLLLSVHDVSEELSCAWNRVLSAVKARKDVDFSDLLLTLCKNHPKDDFDIAEDFINNGYNFYRFANYNLVGFFSINLISGLSTCDYKSHMHFVQNEDGSYDESPSIEDVRERNNNSFLNSFNETSFQDVNLRLIRNAIAFGANPNFEDDPSHKTALDYAKESGINESIFTASNYNGISDIYEFIVDMKPSQKGAILGHVLINGNITKGSISKDLIPEGKTAFDFSNQKIRVVLKSELQTKQAGEPYYKLDFVP